MDSSVHRWWVGVVMLVGVAYFVVGFGFALIATPTVSGRMWFVWRLAAWVVSGAVFAAHVGYEHFRLGSSPRATACHAATAVALGAFLLAVAATVHATMVASHAPYRRFALALVIWPIVTALPAFLVALVAAAVIARLPTKRLAD